ncbi:PREDICTED: uncharacterized protein LOC101304479 [Fragaria vesca subsp. vesca]
MLLKRTDELHLNGMDAGNNTAYNQLDGEEFQQLKHLHVRNAEFRHIINGKGVFPNLKRLVVSGIDGSRFLLSFSMARSLVQLTHLEISGCRTMKEIVSINESDEKHMKDMFSKLQHLELRGLPTLTRFCSRSCTGYPSLEILQQLENYDEVEEMDSRENIQNVLFDAKVIELFVLSICFFHHLYLMRNHVSYMYAQKEKFLNMSINKMIDTCTGSISKLERIVHRWVDQVNDSMAQPNFSREFQKYRDCRDL